MNKVLYFIERYLRQLIVLILVLVGFGLATLAYVEWCKYQEKQAYSLIYKHQKKLASLTETEGGKNYRNLRDMSYFFNRSKQNKLKDYSKEMSKEASLYFKVLMKYSGTRAALAGAIDLADFYWQYSKKQEAGEVLQAFSKKLKNSFLSHLASFQLATYLQDQGNCEQALLLFDKILSSNKHKFFYPSVLLQQALCFEKVKDVKYVVDSYNKIIKDFPDSPEARTAQTYLRIFKLNLKTQK